MQSSKFFTWKFWVIYSNHCRIRKREREREKSILHATYATVCNDNFHDRRTIVPWPWNANKLCSSIEPFPSFASFLCSVSLRACAFKSGSHASSAQILPCTLTLGSFYEHLWLSQVVIISVIVLSLERTSHFSSNCEISQEFVLLL